LPWKSFADEIMDKEKFEVSYEEPDKEKELIEWVGKIVKSAKVVHYGSEGKLTIQFTDGASKVYWFNDLAFWEERRNQ